MVVGLQYKMKVLIPIETSSRELLYKIYLSKLLALNGFECYIGSKRNIFFLLNKLSNYIYLDKGYHKGISDNLYDLIKNKGGYIMNLDEEGAIDFPDNSTLKSRYSSNLFKNSEKIFLWGKYQLNLLNSLGLSSKKNIVSGHPRFELLNKQFNIIYEDSVKSIKELYGDFILINSNFGFGNNIKGDDFVVENYSSRFKELRQIIEFDKVKLKFYLDLVSKLSKQTNKNIIFRPHPEENQEIYLDAFEKMDNVFVNSNDSVVPWIIASDVLIHPDCTTAIESIMLGYKPISYLPKGYNAKITTYLPIEISKCFFDSSILISFLKSHKQFEVKKADLKKIDYYFNFNNSSSEKIVNNFVKFSNTLKDLNCVELSFFDRIFINIRDLFIKYSTSKNYKLSNNKLLGFNFKSIKLLSNKINLVNSNLSEINVSMISSQLVKIYKIKE